MKGRLALVMFASVGCLHDWDSIPAAPTADAAVDLGPVWDSPDDLDDVTADAMTTADAVGAMDAATAMDAPDAPASEDTPDAVAPLDAPDAPAPSDAVDARTDVAVDRPSDIAVDRPSDACPAGLNRCGDACVDLSSDVRNCRICGFACPPRINVTPACNESACSIACNAGYRMLPNEDCVAFAGATSRDDSVTSCVANPTTGTCMCPIGFSSTSIPLRARAEASGSPVVNGNLTLCGVPAFVPGSDWGGAFLRARGIPLASSCRLGNAYAGGNCSCPTGIDVALRFEVGVGTDNALMDLVLCLPSTSPERTFLGAFEQLLAGYFDPTTRTTHCLFANPLTGACTCPAGARTVTARTIALGSLRVGEPNIYMNSPTAPARITLCMR